MPPGTTHLEAPRLNTPRLTLRQWVSDDIRPFAEMCADAEVMRWIGSGRTLSMEESRSAVERIASFWDRNGFGLFAVEVKASGAFAGFCGLSIPTFLPEILPAVEIGWRLARGVWGQGYATEAAGACLRFGFSEAGLDEIISIHQIGNDASERIMKKLGMEWDRSTTDPTCLKQINVYRIRHTGNS